MGWAYYLALALTDRAPWPTCTTIRIDEPEPEPIAGGAERPPAIDVRGALEAIRAVPGLTMLILLAAFNNLLAGVFMALMDAYGLELVSVETWGLLWGLISLAFIAGGLFVSRYGLGPNPLRIVLIGNLVNWAVCSVFALRSSIVLVTIGMIVWLALIPVIEAAEQTVLQRVDPLRAPGSGLRVRPAGREHGVSAHRLPHGAAGRGRVHAAHDRRAGRRPDRRLVRHRSRPRHRPDVHARRHHRRRRHRPRLDVAVLPPAVDRTGVIKLARRWRATGSSPPANVRCWSAFFATSWPQVRLVDGSASVKLTLCGQCRVAPKPTRALVCMKRRDPANQMPDPQRLAHNKRRSARLDLTGNRLHARRPSNCSARGADSGAAAPLTRSHSL